MNYMGIEESLKEDWMAQSCSTQLENTNIVFIFSLFLK